MCSARETVTIMRPSASPTPFGAVNSMSSNARIIFHMDDFFHLRWTDTGSSTSDWFVRSTDSCHGHLKSKNEFNEIISGPKLDELKRAERQFVFGAADIRYGFSERYVKQATQGESQSAAVVDPLCALPRN